MRDCRIYPVNQLGTYEYVVVISRYQGKLLLSRHRDRTTWETQGGHIEAGETPLQAAERELMEESGAIEFTVTPAFDYWAADDTSWANGMVFLADIQRLGPLPDSEMAEVGLFETLPPLLTYPWMTPMLVERAGLWS